MPFVREAIKENDEPERVPPPPQVKGQKQTLHHIMCIHRITTNYRHILRRERAVHINVKTQLPFSSAKH